MNSETYVVRKGNDVLATFDEYEGAVSYAKQENGYVTLVAHNPTVKRMWRVSLTCGKLFDSSPDIAIDAILGDSARRSHGQMYAGNPGIWIVYVEAIGKEDAKEKAKEIVVEALKRA